MNRFVVLVEVFSSQWYSLSRSGLKRSRPCSRPWPSGPSARHKPGDKQKQSEGTEPRPATVPYTSHEGFSQTGGRASRQQPVITEVVRCDDSGMLIASFFFFFSFRVAAKPAGPSAHALRVQKNEEVFHRRSINALKQLWAEIKCFAFLQLLSDDVDADNKLTPRCGKSSGH